MQITNTKHLYPFIAKRSLAGYPTVDCNNELTTVSRKNPRPNPLEAGGFYELKDSNREDYSIDGILNLNRPTQTQFALKLYFPEDRDWAALARKTKGVDCPAGHVCVGKGTGYDGRNTFGLPFHKDFMKLRLEGESCWGEQGDGTADRSDCCVAIAHWERQTGLKFSKIVEEEVESNKMRNIQLKNEPGLWDVISRIAIKKELKVWSESESSQDFIAYIPYHGQIRGDRENFPYSGGVPITVSPGEFITTLESLPNKKKEVELDVGFGGYKVLLTAEGVEFLGEYAVPFVDFEKIAAAVNDFLKK